MLVLKGGFPGTLIVGTASTGGESFTLATRLYRESCDACFRALVCRWLGCVPPSYYRFRPNHGATPRGRYRRQRGSDRAVSQTSGYPAWSRSLLSGSWRNCARFTRGNDRNQLRGCLIPLSRWYLARAART